MLHHSSSPVTGVVITAVVVVVIYFSTIIGRRMGYSGLGGNTIVRCSKGHLFTTIWVPGGSLKSIRLGFVRLQYCPVGKHWAVVKPVKESELTDREKQIASENKDTRIP